MKKYTFLTLALFIAFSIALNAQVAPSGGNNLQYNESTGPHNNTSPFSYTYTAGTGTNRLMLLIITHESQAANQINDFASVIYAGQAFTQQANINVGGTGGTFSNRVAIYSLKESGIAAASSTTVTINYSNANNLKGVGVSTIMLVNVNQIRPVESARTNSGAAVTSLAAPTSFFAEVGNYVVAGVNVGTSTNSVTASAGYTLNHNNNAATGSHRHGYSSKAITTGANETPGFTFASDRAAFASVEVNNLLITVPVELVSFTANKKNNAVTLNWQVGEEKNVNSYVIERMKEGGVFIPIAAISAANISNSVYSYIDNNPTNSNSFYRLKITDSDGSIKYSNTLLIKAGSLVKTIVNSPFTNNINILIQAEEKENASISLFTQEGKLVYKENKVLLSGVNSFAIQPPTLLAAGVYYLTIESSSGKEVIKILK